MERPPGANPMEAPSGTDKRMRRMSLFFVAALAGGCGGEFLLTGPDVVGLPGQIAPVVVRLQRREFWFYAPPVRDAPMTFRLGEDPLRCARTDKSGYAAISIELPASTGRHQLSLHHQDSTGEVVSGTVTAYVLAGDTPVVAVDFDSLPADGKAAAEAIAALERIQAQAQLVYLTQRYPAPPRRPEAFLERAGYPRAAVLPCEKNRTWYRKLPWRKPDEPNMLALLRQRLPRLRWGVAANDDSAEMFQQGGLIVLGVADASAREASTEFFNSWAELKLPPAPAPD